MIFYLISMNSMRIQLKTLSNSLTETSERTNKKVNFVTDRISEQLQKKP